MQHQNKLPFYDIVLSLLYFTFVGIVVESLEAFGKICLQLLQDVQERLVFRAHLYLQSDILNYKPSPGDLAYPEKLEMMEVRVVHSRYCLLLITKNRMPYL